MQNPLRPFIFICATLRPSFRTRNRPGPESITTIRQLISPDRGQPFRDFFSSNQPYLVNPRRHFSVFSFSR